MTTLLLLSLMVAMTLAMVIAVSSDSLITRYYRNFRSSFYAADSGLNVARQYMLDQLEAAISPRGDRPEHRTASDLPGLIDHIVQRFTCMVLPDRPRTAAINSGQGAGSWPGSFQVSSVTLGSAAGDKPHGSTTARHPAARRPTPVAPAPPEIRPMFTYTVPYSITDYRSIPGQRADHHHR